MLLERAFRLSIYLSLAFASLALGLAEWPYLPEMPAFVIPTLIILVVAYKSEGRFVLSAAAANGIAFVIVLCTGVWVGHRFSTLMDVIMEDAPPFAAMLPFLGPVLMLLMLAKLFRPKRPSDFWLLHTIGLMMIVLGCVLANDVIFGILMYAYVVSALWSMTLFYIYREHVLGVERARDLERQRAQDRRRRRSKPRTPQGIVHEGGDAGFTSSHGQPLTPWRMLGLLQASRLSLLVLAVGMLMFLVTPHFGQSWTPFQANRDGKSSSTGYSEGAIDLTRTGEIRIDNREAFEIKAFLADGVSPKKNLSLDTRFRGATMRSYDRGRWMSYNMSSPLSGSPAGRLRKPLPETLPDLGPRQYFIDFTIETKTAGGLFLAEPIISLGADEPLPIINLGGPNPTFHEREGTVVASMGIRQGRYHYRQAVVPNDERDLGPALENDLVNEDLVHQKDPDIDTWTRLLVERLVREGKLQQGDVRLGQSMATPREQWNKVANAFCNYLAFSKDFTYTLVQKRQDKKVDPTYDFLNNVKQGHCERYATALVLMLRSVGVPSRVIKGFRGCEQRPDDRGTYFVRQSQAHSWAEALVERTDKDGGKHLHWLMLDPTPGTSADSGFNFSLNLQNLANHIEALWRNYVVDYNADQRKETISHVNAIFLNVRSWFTTAGNLAAGPLSWTFWSDPRPWLLIAALGSLFLLLTRHARRRQKILRNPYSVEFYAEYLRVLERRCQVRPDGAQTPGEFVTVAQEALRLRRVADDVLHLPRHIAKLYYRVRFGGMALTPDETKKISSLMNQLDRALIRTSEAPQ